MVLYPYTSTPYTTRMALDEAVLERRQYTVDSRYLEVEGTLWNTSRYPYFDISDLQNWGKYQLNNRISQMNIKFDSFS